MLRPKTGEVTGRRAVQGLVGHCEDLGCYCRWLLPRSKGVEQRNDVIWMMFAMDRSRHCVSERSSLDRGRQEWKWERRLEHSCSCHEVRRGQPESSGSGEAGGKGPDSGHIFQAEPGGLVDVY